MLEADLELGGVDQKFNLLMGRELQKHYQKDAQAIMTMPLLEGTDGIKKMSKSLGNYIAIQDEPSMMFGKIMSISDNLMWRYLTLLSSKSLQELQKLQQAAKEGLNPRDIKLEFAQEMVAKFYGSKASVDARSGFIQQFQQKITPEDLPLLEVEYENNLSLAQLLKKLNLMKSTSEALRLIKQGGLKIDGVKIEDAALELPLNSEFILNVGKRTVVKVKISK